MDGKEKGSGEDGSCPPETNDGKSKRRISERRPSGGSMVTFLVTILVITIVFHALIFTAYDIWLGPDGIWRIILLSTIVFMVLFTFLSMLVSHSVKNVFTKILSLLSGLWMGSLFYWIISSLLLVAAYLVLLAAGRTDLVDSYGVYVGSISAGIILGLLLLGMWNANRIRTTMIEYGSSKISADKVRIAIISDVHFGPLLGQGFLRKIERIVVGKRPDILIAAGDIIDLNPSLLSDLEKPLKALFSRYSTYAVTGNHEYFSDPEGCREMMKRCGARVLVDEFVVDGPTGLQLMGVEDYSGTSLYGPRSDAIKGLATKMDPALATVLINHQPFDFELASCLGIEIQVSGHTHGGQIWPFSSVTKAIFGKYYKGMSRKGVSMLYTSNGVGTWGPPVRIGAPPEIVFIDIVKS